MTNFAVKTTLAVLLASTPFAGAYAQPLNSQMSPEDSVYSRSINTTVDNFTTASIKPAAADIVGKSPADLAYEASIAAPRQGASETLSQLLASQIKAAEGNVAAALQNGYVDAGRVSQLRSQINAVRQQATGNLNSTTFNDLSAQLKAVNQGAYALVTG